MVKRQYVLLTTPRKPTRTTRTLCNDLSHNFPNVIRINRAPVLSLNEAVSGKFDVVMQVLTSSLNRITVTFRFIPELVKVGQQMRISHLAWELTR